MATREKKISSKDHPGPPGPPFGGPPYGGPYGPPPPPYRRHYHGGESFGAGIFAGTLLGLGTAALVGLALSDVNDKYKEERGRDMPACKDLPPSVEKCIKPKNCHETSDGRSVCFFKCPEKKEEACYY